jgi:hypothetical protein
MMKYSHSRFMGHVIEDLLEESQLGFFVLWFDDHCDLEFWRIQDTLGMGIMEVEAISASSGFEMRGNLRFYLKWVGEGG